MAKSSKTQKSKKKKKYTRQKRSYFHKRVNLSKWLPWSLGIFGVVAIVIAIGYSLGTIKRIHNNSSNKKHIINTTILKKTDKSSATLHKIQKTSTHRKNKISRKNKKTPPQTKPTMHTHKIMKHPMKKKNLNPTKKKQRIHRQEYKSVAVNKKKNMKKKREKKRTSLAYRGKKAKLVIIIDDVHTKHQLDAIRALPFPVTPSIFPPYTHSKHSNKLVRGLKHYMIHLPMESGSRQFNSQTKTLMCSTPLRQVRKRVDELRRLFPHAVFVNNHTGSTFTSNYRAMKQLYGLLKAKGFTFVDSFTIGSSKVRKIAHEEGDAYVRRDIFIDNKPSMGYIHKQLKKAVRIAKKRGYAIAIGHPHKTTFQALKHAKPILNNVDVVYIDSIYKRE